MNENPMCCGSSPFFGCRFSLYPMTDKFVPVILDAIEEIKRPGIEVKTNDVSTCIIGVETNVFAALRDCLAKAAATGEHVVMSATFSKGCPGEGIVNLKDYTFPPDADFSAKAGSELDVACQFSIYPLGQPDYMKIISDVVDITKKADVYSGSVHFCTRLEGSIEKVFSSLESSFKHTTEHAGHTVMTATLSCNSPSKK